MDYYDSSSSSGGGDSTMMIVLVMIICCCCFLSLGYLAAGYMVNKGTVSFGPLDSFLSAPFKLFSGTGEGDDEDYDNDEGGDEGGDITTGGGGGGDDGKSGKKSKGDKDKDKKDKKDKKNDKDKKYKDNCVYLYKDIDGKGYMKSMCVSRSNPTQYWENGKIHELSSIRYGPDVQVHILPRNDANTKSALKFNDGKTKAGKLVNLTKHDFNDQAGAISLAFKEYGGGTLKNVGGNYDENCVYLYSNGNAKSYVRTICSKKNKSVVIIHPTLKQVSSMRIGKNVDVTIKRKNSSGGDTSLLYKGTGTKNVINLSSSWNDQITSVSVSR